jgi:actin-related protein 6
MDEALRYCSPPLDQESDRKDHSVETNKFEDRKKPELSQNVMPLISDSQLLKGVSTSF